MQTNLGDFGGGSKPEPKTLRLAKYHLKTASPDATLEQHSCPWCLHPDVSNDRCQHCDARIPVDADWYQEGKKICI